MCHFGVINVRALRIEIACRQFSCLHQRVVAWFYCDS